MRNLVFYQGSITSVSVSCICVCVCVSFLILFITAITNLIRKVFRKQEVITFSVTGMSVNVFHSKSQVLLLPMTVDLCLPRYNRLREDQGLMMFIVHYTKGVSKHCKDYHERSLQVNDRILKDFIKSLYASKVNCICMPSI